MFAIVSNITNEAVIIDHYSNYKSVMQEGDSVVIKDDANTIYVDCHLVKIS